MTERAPADVRSAGRIPLVIGVCGHRALASASTPILAEAVRAALRQLRAAFPASPHIVLCSLAEGADRIAARVALEESATLVAVLPAPPDVCEREFADPASRAEFRDLYARATARHVLTAGDAVSERGYVAVAKSLARRAHVLLALWDGKAPRGPGGTGTIVRAFRAARLPADVRNSTAIPDEPWGVMAWIRTPRADAPSGEAGACAWEEVGATGSRALSSPHECRDVRLRELEALNAGLARRPALARSTDSLGDRMRATSDYADALTRDRARLHAAVTAALIVAVTMFTVWHLLRSDWMWALPAYAALIVAAVAGDWWVKRRAFESRVWLTRSVAEGLRVQIAWRQVGATDLVADRYPRFAAPDIRALRGIMLGATAECPCAAGPATAERMRAVRDEWVAAQASYYSGRASQYERESRRHDRLWHATLAVHVLTVAWVFWAMTAGPWHAGAAAPAHAGIPPYHWGILLVIWPLAFVTLIRQGYLRHGRVAEWRRYRGAAELFARADASLVAALEARDLPRARALVRALGDEALAEHAEWLMLHLDRPLEIEPA